ncbi:MAG: glycoside hydrolase family 127 protein [Bacteroidaceae bacterium]|nr:glycoside hydrolase family 127 protein [Bacteroidaceae bacterium]
MKRFLIPLVMAACAQVVSAQSLLYPQHFDLSEVTLLDGSLKQAQDGNAQLLLRYDADRLLAPFIRQAGLHQVKGGKYEGWLQKHPSFSNWGLSDWSLEGHVGGHYLTALAMASVAVDDESLQQQLRQRLDYCVDVLRDCQNAFAENTEGLRGFIGGQPINQVWTGLYAGSLDNFRQYGGWVPFYCEHKVLAGLRDAWVYAGNETARECFRQLADWAVDVIGKLSQEQLDQLLGWEHGGMNESLADAYHLFGDARYLTAAKRYSHQWMLNEMQTLNTTFLDGKHANTQVPKYIGFDRIFDEDSKATNYQRAAKNFWQDVTANRTVCIGGNSTREHFFNKSEAARYINDLDGPESCNSNNMLKLSENLFDQTHDARYADFYEQTMLNHILSTRDPKTGGYVYFTTLRPQGYRIYSQVNQGMWCCVGTGMENHSKYAHFAYTHDGDKALYVNLFVPSELKSSQFGLRQETMFPYIDPVRSNIPTSQTAVSELTVSRAGTYIIYMRHPAWAGKEYAVKVNGADVNAAVTEGKASYVPIERTWQVGDRITVWLPMTLRYEECPGYGDYIAFKFGPVLLAAKTTAATAAESKETGLEYEQLQNEYGGEGRMDHAPGSRASSKDLSSAPLLIGERASVLNRITPKDLSQLTFTIDAASEQSKGNWTKLTLEPFYGIHHARYACYWYQATKEVYDQSDMGRADAEAAALAARTLDFVATGEQQSEAGHSYAYSSDSRTGTYNGETYRDAQANGYIQYKLANPDGLTEGVAIMLRLTTADNGRMGYVTIDGTKIADITVAASAKNQDSRGFYNLELLIPANLLRKSNGKAKTEITFRLTASATTPIPGLYYVRLVKDYKDQSYIFHATDWVTGDPNRVAQSNISYDDDANTLTVNASGTNNVALALDWQKLDYEINANQKFLIVKGKNLSRTSGANYLWWLNGVNKGSQVAPTTTKKAADDGVIIAWDMTRSGLDGNNTGDRFSICQGNTIFGLTSPTGKAVIEHIGFYESVAAFELVTHVSAAMDEQRSYKDTAIYTLDGKHLSHARPGLQIVNGQKRLITQ